MAAARLPRYARARATCVFVTGGRVKRAERGKAEFSAWVFVRMEAGDGMVVEVKVGSCE